MAVEPRLPALLGVDARLFTSLRARTEDEVAFYFELENDPDNLATWMRYAAWLDKSPSEELTCGEVGVSINSELAARIRFMIASQG